MKKLLSIIVATITVSFCYGQGLKDIKINELLIKNVTSTTDDHSNHTSWIELHNTGYTSANLAGAHLNYICDGDTIKYKIPKNDNRTVIAPQGYLMFYASGSTNKGTFHTNFELSSDAVHEAAMIILADQSGATIIDSVTYYPAKQRADVSIGRIADLKDSEKIVFIELKGITPMQSNELEEKISKDEIFRTEDPTGKDMAIVAMAVVFTALAVLFLIFKVMGIAMQAQMRKKENSSMTTSKVAANLINGEGSDISGEQVAAIAIAMDLYYTEKHDIESEIMTINRVAKLYSPWNSKIHTLTKIPRQ